MPSSIMPSSITTVGSFTTVAVERRLAAEAQSSVTDELDCCPRSGKGQCLAGGMMSAAIEAPGDPDADVVDGVGRRDGQGGAFG
jgi:hypothetical protein